MFQRSRKIVQAWLETPTKGVVELSKDWRVKEKPDLLLSGGIQFSTLERMPDLHFGAGHAFYLNHKGQMSFVLFVDSKTFEQYKVDKLYVSGEFNGWRGAADKSWELHPVLLSGRHAFVWHGPVERFMNIGAFRFKFVTGLHHWLPVPESAPNIVRDDQGNTNYLFEPERTGHHLYEFTLAAPLDLSKAWQVVWLKEGGEGAPLRPDGFFFDLRSDLPLGSIVRNGQTVFRIFAPRASKVELCLSTSVEPKAEVMHYSLCRRGEPVERLRELLSGSSVSTPAQRSIATPTQPHNWQGVWEVTLDQDLHGWYYWYSIDGPAGPYSLFQKSQRVIDPYAQAVVGREGPCIVMDAARIGKLSKTFKTPPWQDLVIAEAHVRDLTANAPLELSAAERLGFSGLRKWVDSPEFYLHRLGVNCVELQPIHEYDSRTKEEYAWGYMPVSWFAPASAYSLDPLKGSAVAEFRALVEAFHRRGMAVVLDVVFNHQGEPAGLMFVDKHYYFECNATGHLMNWSGCGNDFRASSAMARRLIIDSCIHMMDTYGVDGFRFDLAELLGVSVLHDIEKSLKAVKRDVILIAEPWSFRGHIAGQLAETGWSSWNDGYRNFMRDYVRGGGNAAQLEYLMKGSPWYFARWPAQTVNYTESHDDRAWIDMITENGSGSGHFVTAGDRRRTHLMAAILFASLGIPMISAGQDFLRSKHGVTNTYLRGDLNALEYRRIHRFSGTHAYFAEWIAFRLSEQGRLLRQWSCPTDGFFRSFNSPDSPAMALLYNADASQGPGHLLFAVNATNEDRVIPMPADIAALPWRQLADHERFYAKGFKGCHLQVEPWLVIPAQSCALWTC